MTPLFVPGAPGGPELLIILFILAILFAIGVAVIGLAALVLIARRSGDQ